MRHATCDMRHAFAIYMRDMYMYVSINCDVHVDTAWPHVLASCRRVVSLFLRAYCVYRLPSLHRVVSARAGPDSRVDLAQVFSYCARACMLMVVSTIVVTPACVVTLTRAHISTQIYNACLYIYMHACMLNYIETHL